MVASRARVVELKRSREEGEERGGLPDSFE
jgi:hypothetical protein